MKITKGTIMEINHSRKGKFDGIAIRDFDTETEEFYPIALYQESMVEGNCTEWEHGEAIPCIGTLCKIKIK